MALELEVNGARRRVEAAPDTPLLYVLRNDLGLTGSRFGCGSGQCGACFVLVEGRAMASCDLPIESVSGKAILTIEGLGGRHPVQKALVAEQAAQCGYCMSGIVMSAAALLSQKPDPTEEEIRTALDRNLCRCGSHNRVVRA
ncbi:MAG: (2Fe-2S)-binding protein, partial [Geminicoccales bacterium]